MLERKVGRMRFKNWTPLAVVATAGLVVSACGSSSSATQNSKATSATKAPVLTIAELSPPLSFDPSAAANGNFDIQFISPAYSSLIQYNTKGQMVPGLATKWGYVGSGSTKFEITLRPNIKFANGTPLTAQDVVASMEHYKKGSGPGSPFFKDITASASGTNTVILTSSKPNPFIATLLTPKWMAGDIVSPAGLANPSLLKSGTYGAGKYQVDQTQSTPGSQYVYVPNKYYYKQSGIHFSKIVVKIIPSETSELEALKSGQIEEMYANAPTASAAQSVSGLSVIAKPVSWDGLIILDHNGVVTPALSHVRVRQALNYAVNRSAIVKAVYGKWGSPTEEATTPGPGYGFTSKINSTYSYDPAKAKQLLAAAGYPHGFTFTALDRSELPGENAMMQAVASQLSQIGVTLNLKPELTIGAWVPRLISKHYPATGNATSGKPAVMTVPYMWLPGGIFNVFGNANPTIAAAYQNLLNAPSTSQSSLADQIMQQSVTQALDVPIVGVDDIFIYNTNKLSGVQFDANAPFLTTIENWTPKA